MGLCNWKTNREEGAQVWLVVMEMTERKKHNGLVNCELQLAAAKARVKQKNYMSIRYGIIFYHRSSVLSRRSSVSS